MMMNETVRNKRSALLRNTGVSCGGRCELTMIMHKSQLSLKRLHSDPILGRLGALSVLKQSELIKNKNTKKIGGLTP